MIRGNWNTDTMNKKSQKVGLNDCMSLLEFPLQVVWFINISGEKDPDCSVIWWTSENGVA